MNGGAAESVWRPAADRYATPEAVVIEVDVPGAKREAVRVTLERGELLVEAPISEPEGDVVGAAVVRGRYRRSFLVPEDVDGAAVRARLSAGVLRVTLPKVERTPARTVEIVAG